MDKPAVYRIRVRGVLPDGWLDRLGGLQVTAKTMECVTLEGQLPDQAALAGVLDTLYSLHLPILEVTCLEEHWYCLKAFEWSLEK
jgi:hypothetical protein